MNSSCNNSISLCWQSKLEPYGYFCLHMPCALMGIVTNTLTLLVFHQRPFQARVTAYTLLQAMAVMDFITCFLILPIGFCRCIEPSEQWETYVQQFYDIYIYLPLCNTFGTASVFLTMFVSIERYMSVAHALKAKKLWSSRFTSLVIVMCLLCGFVINMPYFFLREISEEPPPGYTEWGQSNGSKVYSWIRMVIIKFIPISVVAFLNTLLIIAVWKLNKRHTRMVHPESSSSSILARQQLQMRVTAMVVSISIVYIACHLPEPFAHSGVFTTLFGECSRYGKGHRTLIITVNVLETFSYASNFFFYYKFNRQFACTLRAFCECECCVLDRQKSGDNTDTITLHSIYE